MTDINSRCEPPKAYEQLLFHWLRTESGGVMIVKWHPGTGAWQFYGKTEYWYPGPLGRAGYTYLGPVEAFKP